MTRQEMFNKAVAGLAGQGFKRSVTSGGSCRYRDVEGRKCAVGHLIPDEVYQSSFEGKTIGYLLKQCPELGTLLHGRSPTGEEFLLELLQWAHDVGKVPAVMRENLRVVASQYNLKIPEVLCEVETASACIDEFDRLPRSGR